MHPAPLIETPPPITTQAFGDGAAAVARLEEIYERNTGFLRNRFEAYVNGPARAEHDRIIDEAEALGVFGVPSMVFNGELFWGGDRIDLLIERIRNPGSIALALGSRHRT